jgi:hypothetical protein
MFSPILIYFVTYTIVPHLILVDKSKVCAVDGMNQMFTVVRTEDGGKEVIIKSGIQRSDLTLQF